MQEELLREIRDNMMANTELMSKLVKEKTSSAIEPFTMYVSWPAV